MSRRIILAIAGTTLVALVLSGLGTLLLSRATARAEARNQLEGIAPALAESVAESLRATSQVANRSDSRQFPRILTSLLNDALDIDGLDVIVIGPNGRPTEVLPQGLVFDDLPVPGSGSSVNTWSVEGQVWVAARARVDLERELVIVMRTTPQADLGQATRWFLVASAGALLISAVVATRLSRRLTRPLAAVQQATAKIAGGQLDARVAEPSAGGDELSSLAHSVNAMVESLERSQGLEQQFLLSVSHDLRTPLTSIKGYAEALGDGTADNPELRLKASEVIKSQAERLERLVGDLLQLARLDARQFTLEMRPVDIGAVVQRATDGFVPDLASKGIAITATMPATTSIVRSDPERVGQVVANLVENAAKFANDTIEVHMEDTPHGVRVSVHDDGPGIATQDQPHVFERLYVPRRQPVRAEAGSGLGLAIVRELIEAMGGSVAVSDSHLGGATLTFVIPS